MNLQARDQAVRFITSWLEYQSRQLHVPGFVVAIQLEGEQVLLEAYGQANVERQEPMRVDHVFGVASISKMFTATAIMQLVEQGRLSLDDHVCKYLQWLKQHTDTRVQEVTIRHLLGHTAGFLRDGHDSDFWQLLRPFPGEEELQSGVLEAPLVDRPGNKLKYSNIGYALLGQIIQQVSGLSYSEYVTRGIIAPLGLRHTTPEYSPTIRPHIATGYTRPFDRQRLPVPAAIDTRSFTPLFGCHTTAQDLCRFMAAHFIRQDTLLSEESKALLHAYGRGHWVPPMYRGTEYGLGFMTQHFGHRRVVGHGGVFVGHRSCAYADADNKLIVVILANARDAPVIDMLQGILSAFDYFETWGGEPVTPERDRFNVRLMGFWATLQIVATEKRIVSIFPDLWMPFADPDELVQTGPNTLRITKTHDFASAGETITLNFQKESVTSAQYAGTTLLTESGYQSKLRRGFLEQY